MMQKITNFREYKTQQTIDAANSMLLTDRHKPEYAFLPILSEIALSLASIADSLRKDDRYMEMEDDGK